jgi:hypothetical protein
VHLINWKYAEKAGGFVELLHPIATHTDRIAKKQEVEADQCRRIRVICRAAEGATLGAQSQ